MPDPAPPEPINDGPDHPCLVRATTTPWPPLPLKINAALTTVMIASPLECRSTSLGIPLSGICRKSRTIAAQWSTVPCSVPLAVTTDRESMARLENTFVSGLQLVRQHNRVRMYFGWKRIDPVSSLSVGGISFY